MAQLTWENWYRSDGCRKWMDKTTFAGTSFTDIFWQGMRLVFMDEHGKHGLLYTGGVGIYANQLIKANNGKMVGFTSKDNERMLWKGDFHYNDPSYQPPSQKDRLRFEGPDKPDLKTPIYTRSDMNGSRICVQFYNIVKDAQQGSGVFQHPVPQNASGIKQLAYFTGAYVLSGIMFNHGFGYPNPVNGQPDYAHTLPQIALHATLTYAKAMLDMDGISSSSLPLQASMEGKAVPA